MSIEDTKGVQSNHVNADTEGAIEIRGVRIKRVKFIDSLRAFFPLGQSKLSEKRPYKAGVRKAGFDCI